METAPQTAEQLAVELKLALKEIGGGAKTCAIAVSAPDSLIRIIEQPETPREILRDAIRLNGLSLLNQDVKEFVLDCEKIPSADAPAQPAAPAAGAAAVVPHPPVKYLVAGLPRSRVQIIDQASRSTARPASAASSSPPSAPFNAFEFSHPEIFTSEAFLLVDIGHHNSTVTVGVKKELVIVRAIEYGRGPISKEFLVSNGAPNPAEAFRMLEMYDELTVDNARLSLAALTREIASSIGFFEGRREENITRVYVSGGGARLKTLLSILSSELHIPCEAWDPFAHCEIALPAARKEDPRPKISSASM